MMLTSDQTKVGLIAGMLLLGVLSFPVSAQTDLGIPGATARAARAHPVVDAEASTNVPAATSPALSPPAEAPSAEPMAPSVATPIPATSSNVPTISSPPPAELSSRQTAPPVRVLHSVPGWWIGQLLILGAVGGFIAYYCGLTRAKNCGHTCTVLLMGVMFGLTGFWISGFAVQTGGLEDAHAALMVPVSSPAISGLDHELSIMAGGHHWGFMGSAGFFLNADAETRNETAMLFLGQAILLALVVTVALGGALERARLLAMGISAFLVGALIYPLFANWVWGGGWLAELGREFGLGHGLIDLAGAGVIHLTAGTLALVFALELGPRYGRFGRNNEATAIPGHNVPFVILGSAAILLALTAMNAVAYPGPSGEESAAGLSASNTLLGAAGGLLATFFLTSYKRLRPDPARLCRGLIGGAVAVSAGSALFDAWAAFVVGMIAAAAVQGTVELLERRRIDDPVGAVAVHGAGGAWGLVAVGFFANSSSGAGINGVSGPVRSLFFGHDGLQLVAQILGCIVCCAVVFALGYGCMTLLQKIVGIRVDVADETGGLDWPQLGALGYQADAEVEKEK